MFILVEFDSFSGNARSVTFEIIFEHLHCMEIPSNTYVIVVKVKVQTMYRSTPEDYKV